MKHILFLNLVAYSQTGGIENFSRSVIRALSDIASKSRCTAESVSLYDAESPRYPNVKIVNYAGCKTRFIAFACRRVYHADIVISNHVNLLPVCALLKVLNPRITLYTAVYGIDIWRRLAFLKRLALPLTRILSISSYTTETACAVNGIARDRVDYFPCAFDGATGRGFDNVFEPGTVNLLTVSRLTQDDAYKGIDHVITALKSVMSKVPTMRYTVIGKGDDLPRLRELAAASGLLDRIAFLGFVDDLGPYYEHCDVFVLPSQCEGFGIVYLEAMDFATPVIACRSGGATDVVIDGETGLLCDYGDIQALSRAITTLANDPALRARLGQGGERYYRENFTYSHLCRRLEAIVTNSEPSAT